jgi:hypothetical protein
MLPYILEDTPITDRTHGIILILIIFLAPLAVPAPPLAGEVWRIGLLQGLSSSTGEPPVDVSR